MSVRQQKRRDPKSGAVRTFWMVDVAFEHADGRVERVRKVSPVQTRRGAETYERELRQSLLTGQREKEVAKAAVPTVAEFQEAFLKHARTRNRPSEVDVKESVLRRLIVPRFGKFKLSELTSKDIETWVSDLQNEGRQKGKKAKGLGLSTKSVRNYVGVLLRMLRLAHRWEHIEKVPNVDLPKLGIHRFRFLDFEEAKRLLDAAEEPWRTLFFVAMRTGLRRGELLALRTEDVDTKAGRLIVRRSRDAKGREGPPKNGKPREVPLGDEVAAALRMHKHLRGEFVFCNDDGSPLTAPQLEKPLARTCKKAGIPLFRMHTLRHTFASHLAMRGASMKEIQELLGHSSLTMTMRYAHLSPDARRQAVRLLDAAPSGNLTATERKEVTKP